jgi:hypothetical protein
MQNSKFADVKIAQHTRGSAWLNFVTRVISWIYGDGVTTSEHALPNNLEDARMVYPKSISTVTQKAH